MKNHLLALIILSASVGGFGTNASLPSSWSSDPFPQENQPALAPTLQSMHFSTDFFVKNIGQLPCDILYYADIQGGRLCIRQNDLVFQFIERSQKPYPSKFKRLRLGERAGDTAPDMRSLSNVYIRFDGGSFADILAEDEQITKLNFFKGNDPNRWVTEIPTFGRIRIQELYPGVSLVFDSGRSAAGLWRFEAADARALSKVRLDVDTPYPVVYESGYLIVDAGSGRFGISYPMFQGDGILNKLAEIAPSGRLQPKAYIRKPAQEGRPMQDEARSAQQLLWGTYLGGSDWDEFASLALDTSKNIILGGYVDSADIPVPQGYDQTFAGDSDIYVAKMSSNGASLLWGTYIGGSQSDECNSIAVDAMNNIYIIGWTDSTDIPVPGGYSMSFHGGEDLYIAKLSSTGSALLGGTYLGGSGNEYGFSIALDAVGDIVVCGFTSSTDIPVPSGFDQIFNGGGADGDMYIAKLASVSSLLWATYLGGKANDRCTGIAVDASGNIIVVGATSSTDIPVPGGFDQGFNGGYDDIYVAKLSSSGSSLLWGTFLGGSGQDYGAALALTPSGDILITGATNSTDLPVPGGYDQGFNGGPEDIYVARLSSTGSSLQWGTYLGGTGDDECYAIVLDEAGNIVIGGFSDSLDIPVPGGYGQAFNGGQYGDIYAARLSAAGSSLLWGTYVGGRNDDYCTSLVLDPSGNILIGATTSSADIPVPAGYDQTFNGGRDFYLAKLSEPSSGGCSLSCSVSATPSSGPVPLTVSFSATGTPAGCTGNPTYSWDLGNGFTSNIQNPTPTYGSSGTFTWTMTAMVDGVTCAKTGDIEVFPPGKCTGTPIFIAASAHAGGAGGSQWRTDLALLNASTSDGSISLKYLPQGSDNTTAVCIGMGSINAGSSMAFNDVVLSTFGVNPGSGGIAIYTDSSNLMAMSRTYNQAASGTFGQGIPGRTAAQGIAAGRKGYLMQLHQNSAYRTNIGFLNPSSATLTLRVDLYDEGGTLLGTLNYTLNPYDQYQEGQIFTKVTSSSVTNGRAEVKATGGPVLAYASVVDNATGDGTYIEPF